MRVRSLARRFGGQGLGAFDLIDRRGLLKWNQQNRPESRMKTFAYCNVIVFIPFKRRGARWAMSITIKGVAKVTGVSVAPVSCALNGRDNVIPGTCERIMQTAQPLHYMPHGAARSLIARRTLTISALLSDLHGVSFSELIRGLDRAVHPSRVAPVGIRFARYR